MNEIKTSLNLCSFKHLLDFIIIIFYIFPFFQFFFLKSKIPYLTPMKSPNDFHLIW